MVNAYSVNYRDCGYTKQ